ncbi:MAG: pirin family protein [Deltaproteobacteria bacterium]|nr:pirin family protein [Deltaproteobacteria bacterium]
MHSVRTIKKILTSAPTIEGAGVHLKRAFGYHQMPYLDPFLLLDDFHSTNPSDYLRGFPWHPHRGIETITYVLQGRVEHGDSLGNQGVISFGDVQWMTAGSGIIHQEMPKGREDGLMWGFQLWANLPASHKMMEPRYRGIKREQIPEIRLDTGVKIKLICGNVNNVRGPVQDIIIDPEYLDVTVPSKTEFTHHVQAGYTVFAYVIKGEAYFDLNKERAIGAENLVIFEHGDEVKISTEKEGARFLLISGRPLREPVAWRGPIVMNTQEELKIAFEEYERGTFLKHR